ncbi:sugar phosphate isomerase/epimerase family protein [Propioniciclava soli]|uniref:sugar phosphate isomerase/epimerase family protein n=1 Tax=Propioniciclava soli TaxID=2775081 RepID=UPI001E31CA93|nr:TIM barrel protein [Propioniciclava soli]
MATLGVMMMMLKQQVADEGMFAVLQRIVAMDLTAVEVSQIPMDAATTADLERGVRELGIDVGALSVALKPGRVATGDNLEESYAKIVDDCGRLETRFVRIGMMPFEAMMAKDAAEAWAAECQSAAERLAADGITLCYHNHHVDLTRFDGELLFDLVRRVAPALNFEVDLHWVQRGGMAPLDMLKRYSGVCKIIHVKDFRVTPVPASAMEFLSAGDFAGWQSAFNNIVQFAEVGQGNMNWPELLPAAEAAGAEYFFIEQDDTYGRDPYDCIADSRRYLASIGY